MISKSPNRHSFQKERYVQRQEDQGESVSEAYLDMFDVTIENHNSRFNDPKSREDNLEYDLLTTEWILSKARESKRYAQNLYAAMCNNDFQKLDTWPVLTNKTWGCSWRYAGGIVADMRQEGDYIDWYCSGIRGDLSDVADTTYDANAYVSESTVTEEIRSDLQKLGWAVLENKNDII